jgi:hypothetical protein
LIGYLLVLQLARRVPVSVESSVRTKIGRQSDRGNPERMELRNLEILRMSVLNIVGNFYPHSHEAFLSRDRNLSGPECAKGVFISIKITFVLSQSTVKRVAVWSALMLNWCGGKCSNHSYPTGGALPVS